MRVVLLRSVACLVLFLAPVMLAQTPAESSLTAGGASLTIQFSESITPAFRKLVEEWVHQAADAVIAVYGHYPVKRVTIEVQIGEGGGVRGGRTWNGQLIKVRVGSDTTRAVFHADWVMTHEMFHLGFPDTEKGLDWMGEGLSTYIEPLARARAGNLSAEEVWVSMLDGLPKGLPQQGDQGLDHTPTWGRTYWGGALFWLLADIEIRQKSGNRKSLDDALRAIAAEGGDGSQTWSASKIFARGDAAIGMPILEALHERLGSRPETTDLAALWRQLGISRSGDSIVFNDNAPLAAVRRALTSNANPLVAVQLTRSFRLRTQSRLRKRPRPTPHPALSRRERVLSALLRTPRGSDRGELVQLCLGRENLRAGVGPLLPSAF
jgi:hypothetical protein